jgi:CheY-like chemotaxis protein
MRPAPLTWMVEQWRFVWSSSMTMIVFARWPVDAVRRCLPDLVLLDIGLPDIDGAEVARQLRNELPDHAVILISTREAEYGGRVAAGIAAGYLPKDELSLAAIKGLLGPAPPGVPAL